MSKRKNFCEIFKKISTSNTNLNEILASKDNSDKIDYLIVLAYDAYMKKTIRKNEFIEIIMQIQLIDIKKYPDATKILERLKWLESMELKYTETGLSQNHKEVMKIFDNFNIMLNNKQIDHYYTSGILPYLLTDTPLQRFHHDIDIFINLDDLRLLEAASVKYGFKFIRKYGYRPDGIKRRIIKMYYKNYNIPITVFMFKRTPEGAVIQTEFIYDEDNNLMVEEMYNTPSCVELSFSEIVHFHNNIPFKAISLEALYECKDGLRSKDVYDCSVMEKFIDKQKLAKLKSDLVLCPKNQIFKVNDADTKQLINNDTIERE